VDSWNRRSLGNASCQIANAVVIEVKIALFKLYEQLKAGKRVA